MMLIDTLNLNELRVFECVFRNKSMTAAAKELHLTQSGVSQHIKNLEDVLELKLFDRISQKLVPTHAAATLYKRCSHSLTSLEHALSELKNGRQVLTGVVSIGMPIEFGNNVVLPLLSEFCKTHRQVRFSLRYGFVTEMTAGLLDGSLDFAFVDDFGLDKRIATEKVYDEKLYLCASSSLLKGAKNQRESKDFFESLEYVDYLAGEPVLRRWFEHHFRLKKIALNVRASVMDVQGVARLILSGLAAGVLPGYLIQKLEHDGKELHRFKGSGKPLKNAISIAYLKEKTNSLAASTAMNSLIHSLNSKEQA